MRETNKARSAFEDYYNMGPGRSIQKLYVLYQSRPEDRPTRHISTLKNWSVVHGWQKRVQQRDLEISEAALDAIKEQATKTGYAVFQKRIHDLGKLAERMFVLLEVGVFQPKAIREFRGLLSDIAAEMGERERKHKIEVEGGDKPIRVRVEYDDDYTPPPTSGAGGGHRQRRTEQRTGVREKVRKDSPGD